MNAKPLILTENFLRNPNVILRPSSGSDTIDFIRDDKIYTYWQSGVEEFKVIEIYSEGLETVDTIAIVNNNFKGKRVYIKLEVNISGNWGIIFELTEFFKSALFFKTFSTRQAEIWRLTIKIISLTPERCLIGELMLGKSLEFERFPASGFSPVNEEVVLESKVNKLGFLTSQLIRYVKISFDITFNNLTENFIRTKFLPLWNDYLSKQLFCVFAWDILQHPQDVYYVRIPEGYKLTLPIEKIRYSLTLTFEGVKL